MKIIKKSWIQFSFVSRYEANSHEHMTSRMPWRMSSRRLSLYQYHWTCKLKCDDNRRTMHTILYFGDVHCTDDHFGTIIFTNSETMATNTIVKQLIELTDTLLHQDANNYFTKWIFVLVSG